MFVCHDNNFYFKDGGMRPTSRPARQPDAAPTVACDLPTESRRRHALVPAARMPPLLLLALLLLLPANALECNPKSCKNPGGKAVCGNDGLTYPSRCHLELSRCHKQNVTIAHRGYCKKPSACLQYVKNYPNQPFKPQCQQNGDFNRSQCSALIGYCWCVDEKGLPIPSSSVKYTPDIKMKCGRKKTTRRSSEAMNRRKNNREKNCKRQDRALFNDKLIEHFKTEWARENTDQSEGIEAEREVLNWKFNKMDLDKNGKLDKSEYRDLRRLLKKAVRPKKCARSFTRSCDTDRDQIITKDEWVECLMNDGGTEDDRFDDGGDPDDDGSDHHNVSAPPHGVLQPFNSAQIYEDESAERRDEDSDCFSDRQTAINEQRADEKYRLYIPECTPDGRYQQVQCYHSVGYCWCVNEDTGKNIPGTSVKNQKPKCDQISTISRPMKGCPDDKKITFLKEVIDFLHDKMMKETNGTSIGGANNPAWKASKDERVATWSFVVFDKNKNHMLEKMEWKAFKDQVGTVKSLKKCGKKLPRYCDINKDRQISMTEWLECLNTRTLELVTTTSATPSSSPRSGLNPIMFLIED